MGKRLIPIYVVTINLHLKRKMFLSFVLLICLSAQISNPLRSTTIENKPQNVLLLLNISTFDII